MSSIIIAFPVGRSKFSHKIRDALSSRGFSDITIVTTASEALQEIDLRQNGVLISCVQLPDMYYRELIDCLPECFSLLLLDTEFNAGTLRESDVVSLTVPIRTHDLINTVRMLDEAADQKLKNKLRQKKRQRAEEDKKTVNAAKLLLMDRNHMTEPEAYRFIQKTSMDTGRTMLETAQMILLFERDS